MENCLNIELCLNLVPHRILDSMKELKYLHWLQHKIYLSFPDFGLKETTQIISMEYLHKWQHLVYPKYLDLNQTSLTYNDQRIWEWNQYLV